MNLIQNVWNRLFKKNRKKSDAKNKEGQYPFGETEDVHKIWDLSDKDAYVKHRWRRRIPRFILPGFVVVLILALVIWIMPGIINRYSDTDEDQQVEATLPVRSYGVSTRVVTQNVANLMSGDDIKSELITQVLYNEPVTVLDKSCAEGFLPIRTQDGIEGYILEEFVTDSLDSIEPGLHKYKLVVSDVSKNVLSHASNGTLMVKVMMNTVLYSDLRGDGVYQVALPDGKTGWLSSNGVIELGVSEAVKKISVRYFVSSVISFVNVTRIDHGITMTGMSVEGLAYVASAVNGLTLPRTMEEQQAVGERVDPTYDEVTGLLDVSSIQPGDLVFFKNPNDPISAAPYEMAICTDTGSVIMASKSRTSLRIVSLTENEALTSRIIAVRRIFS